MDSKANKELSYIKKLIKTDWTTPQSLSDKDVVLIVKLTKDFINQHNLLLYGGHALNALLPKKDRFYKNDNEFHDFDLLSPSAKKHAVMLADIFYTEGFIFTEVRPAIHDGTYKIYVNFVHIADITMVSDTFFYQMLKLSQIERPSHKYIDNELKVIHIAPVYLLKHNIIIQLSRPIGSIVRWEKVYRRLMLFYKYYAKKDKTLFSKKELVSKMTDITEDPNIMKIFEKTIEVIKVNNIPLIGNLALGIYLNKNIKPGSEFFFECCRIDEFFSVFEILSVDYIETIRLFKIHLDPLIKENGFEVKTQQRDFYGEIIPKRIRIYLSTPQGKNISIATIVESNYCYAITEKHGFTIGTPYTILNFMYAYWLVYYVYEDKKIANSMNKLISALETYIKTESPVEERFVINCFGREKSFLDVRKENFRNPSKNFVYRPLTMGKSPIILDKKKTSHKTTKETSKKETRV